MLALLRKIEHCLACPELMDDAVFLHVSFAAGHIVNIEVAQRSRLAQNAVLRMFRVMSHRLGITEIRNILQRQQHGLSHHDVIPPTNNIVLTNLNILSFSFNHLFHIITIYIYPKEDTHDEFQSQITLGHSWRRQYRRRLRHSRPAAIRIE
ncbi:hypothetical protein D1872_282890 [compost metagenome]